MVVGTVEVCTIEGFNCRLREVLLLYNPIDGETAVIQTLLSVIKACMGDLYYKWSALPWITAPPVAHLQRLLSFMRFR